MALPTDLFQNYENMRCLYFYETLHAIYTTRVQQSNYELFVIIGL